MGRQERRRPEVGQDRAQPGRHHGRAPLPSERQRLPHPRLRSRHLPRARPLLGPGRQRGGHLGARTRLGHLRLHDDVPRNARAPLPGACDEGGRLLARRAEPPRGRHPLLGLLVRRRGARRLRLGGDRERAPRAPGVRAAREGGEVPRRRREDARVARVARLLREAGRERRLPAHALRRPQARQQRGERAAQLRRLLLPRGAPRTAWTTSRGRTTASACARTAP